MATVSIYFDNRTTNTGYSVKYLVIHRRVSRLFAAGKIVSDSEMKFLKQYEGGLKGTVKDEDKRILWQEVYGTILGKGQKILEDLGEGFSFSAFRSLLKGGVSKGGPLPNNVFSWYDAEIAENKEAKRGGNKSTFESSKSSIARYARKIGYSDILPFSAVTVDFLKGYEKWMLASGKLDGKKQGGSAASKTTVGFYLRSLRAIYKKQKFTNPDDYPFSGRGYTIPKGRKKKKAMVSSDLERILSYKPESSYKPAAELSDRDAMRLHYRKIGYSLWVFTYLSNGANMADLLRLRKSMIADGKIRFLRKKTINTTEDDPSEVVIHLLPRAKQILEEWWNHQGDKSSSVWNFLAEVDLDDAEEMDRVTNNFVIRVNGHMKRIAKELEITVPVRTYEARHSFATTLARSEVPLLFISQALAHKNIQTTMDYLGSFEDDQASRYMENLMIGGGGEE